MFHKNRETFQNKSVGRGKMTDKLPEFRHKNSQILEDLFLNTAVLEYNILKNVSQETNLRST